MMGKILMCANFYPPFFVGGAEIIAHEQACHLHKAGYEVAVFCGKHDDSLSHYSVTREIYDGLDVFRVILHAQDYQLGQNFYKPIVDELFDAVLKKVQPDVVHFHNIVGLSLGIVARAHRHGIRTVLTLHDHWGFCFKNTLLKEQDLVCNDFSKCGECLPELTDNRGRLIHVHMRNDYIALQLSKVERFISPSLYLSSTYAKAGIPSDKISVISYGVNVKRFSQVVKVSAEEPIRFTFIGYLGVHKGVHILIEAMDLLLKKGYLGNLCTINIIGVGIMADDLAKFVTNNQIESAVKLWGKIAHTQIETVYRCTDVLVTPSIWPENEPVTILEAMAAGIPVLASAIGGNLQLVEDGVNGYLFESGNSVLLAEKMIEMALDRNLIKLMGRKAYEKMAENTLDNYVRRISEVYQDNKSFSANGCDRIILCSGEYVSPECAHVITQFYNNAHNNRYRFIMSDWISPEEWEAVDLLWIVDDKGNEQDLQEALKHGCPLLVPEGNRKLVEMCRVGQCGLFYADEAEAEVCLHYLRDRPSILAALGRNAKGLFEKLTNNLLVL
jgi:glycosyltransferase involved in cell wall biosynthesis